MAQWVRLALRIRRANEGRIRPAHCRAWPTNSKSGSSLDHAQGAGGSLRENEPRALKAPAQVVDWEGRSFQAGTHLHPRGVRPRQVLLGGSWLETRLSRRAFGLHEDGPEVPRARFLEIGPPADPVGAGPFPGEMLPALRRVARPATSSQCPVKHRPLSAPARFGRSHPAAGWARIQCPIHGPGQSAEPPPGPGRSPWDGW